MTIPEGVAPVPVPAAVWLFGSGLIGLIGMAKRSKYM
ncbi:VPLPA-CTERM sorting domain-containing protein [bacterium]|nr:VPLPA-CTERM sorting domain-containing protein [bacterium]